MEYHLAEMSERAMEEGNLISEVRTRQRLDLLCVRSLVGARGMEGESDGAKRRKGKQTGRSQGLPLLD